MTKAKLIQVRLKVSLSGDTGSFAPKDIYTCDEAEAKRLIDKDFAEPINKTRGKGKK